MKGKLDLLRKKLIHKAKEKVAEKFTSRDQHLIKAVNAIADLDNVFNLLFEHVREWYGMHFPELERLCGDNVIYLRLVYNLGDRKNFAYEKICEHYENKLAAKQIEERAQTSMGSPAEEADLAEIKLLALNALNLHEERTFLEKYLEKAMSTVCPNLLAIGGAMVGGRLLGAAGSLKRLALMPGSTIQVLGAEKALFSHLRNGTSSPKHGFLFQHPLVRGVHRTKKGKMARTLGAKIALSVKKDYFGGKENSDAEKKALADRAKQLGGARK